MGTLVPEAWQIRMNAPTSQNLLDQIRKRPGLFLGECSLSALYHLIGGYNIALGMHGIRSDNSLRLPEDFHDWVAYRLHYKESTSGWKNMILGRCTNEAAAFEKFFELLDQHAARQARVIAKLTGIQKTFTRQSGGREKIERYPSRISLITYTDDPGFFVVSDESGCTLPMHGFMPSLDWFETFTGLSRSQLTILDVGTFSLCTETSA